MISIENFYWILFENLLKPVGLDAWYYYPFGTTDNLSTTDEFPSWDQPKREDHVLFHFDQEPLWSTHLGSLYERKGGAWSSKMMRVLANSEQSSIKRKICESRGMLDWYFFYHGFAALDWFRDCQFVAECAPIERVFNSFNHLVTGKRAYRLALTARLLDLGLEDFGHISFHGSDQQLRTEVLDPATELSRQDRNLIESHIVRGSLRRRLLDTEDIDSNSSARLGHKEYKLWQKSFLHLVNETVFYDPKLHLTEKIFKPIVALRPFILVAAPGNLAYLRSYGFKTFSQWIDESYDDELNPGARLDRIGAEVARLCGKSMSELNSIYCDMRPTLQFNKQHFFNAFRDIIIDELVENFDTCIRVWNNGRVDGRERSGFLDLSQIKQVFKK